MRDASDHWGGHKFLAMAHDWQVFRWNLDKTLDASRPVLPPFAFRPADEDERDTVLKVVSSALLMERAWTGAAGDFSRDLERRCDAAFDRKPPSVVVVLHGTRVIGASVLDPTNEAEFHLVTGPCILHEYRSRGLGTALLHHSLTRLREDGLTRAGGLARVNSTAARFLYQKFGGVADPQPDASRLAA